MDSDRCGALPQQSAASVELDRRSAANIGKIGRVLDRDASGHWVVHPIDQSVDHCDWHSASRNSTSDCTMRPDERSMSLKLSAPVALLFCLLFGVEGSAQQQAETSDSETSMTPIIQPLPELGGVWVQLTHQTTISTPALIGEVRTETRTWSVVQVHQAGNDVRLESEICRIDVNTSSRGVRTIIPEAMRRVMSRGSRSGRLILDDSGYQLSLPRVYMLLGAELDNPTTDSLPSSASDPRVIDHDGDGHPGVTVRIRGIVRGEVYLVQRAWSRLLSNQLGERRISGFIQWDEESEVLDATNPFLKMQPDTRPSNLREDNYFIMERFDMTPTCEAVRADPAQFIPQ